MAINDNTSYELTGLQVKDLAQKIRAKADSSSLATVATSGSYTDLTNTPTIPAAQVNSDWNANSGVAQILNKPTLAAVATSGDYADLSNTPTIPTVNDATLTIEQNGTTAGTFTANSSSNTTISLTDTTYTHFTGATSSADGTQGLVPGPLTGDQDKVLHGDGTWKDATAKLVEMSYGESNAWAKFIAAYNAGSIVYCRASSNSNPASGSQTRKAFMAYVNNATTPTSVEFQYVRSVSSKTDSQQSDQVFVYTLTNASGGTWSVTSRNMAPKINVSGPITKTFTTGANASIAIGANAMTGATSSAAGTAGIVPAPAAGDDTKVLSGAGAWVNQPTVNDGTLTIQQNGTTVDTFTANQSTNVTANIDTHNGVLTTNDLSLTTDTVSGWLTLFNSTPGYYVTFYSGTTGFTNQPTTWGQLETFISAQTSDPTRFEIYQRWHSQSDGGEYYRAGNATGWYNEASNSGAFRAVVDYSTPRWSTYTISDTALTDRTWTTPKGRSLTVAAAGNAGVSVGISGGCDRGILAFKMSANYYLSTPINTTIGITNIKANETMTNAFWGVVGTASKAGTVFIRTPTSNYANFYTDTNSSSGIFSFNVSGNRYTGGDWFELSGSLHYGNDYINFVTRCAANGASVLPKIYMRGTAMVLGSRNVTLEVLE